MNAPTRLPRSAALLGYGGLLPFLAGALLAWPGSIDADQVAGVFIAYSATILAFLGGLQWGLALFAGDGRFAERLGVGVLPALLAWVALLLAPLPALGLLALVFAALLAWERMRAFPALPGWYFPLRTRLTIVAVACHGVLALALP